MKQNFISVPFKAESGNSLSEYTGIAKFSSAGIVVEFESKILGLFGSEIKEVRISLDEILDIKFHRGIFKFFSKIKWRLKHFTKTSDLPNEHGKVKLKIKREDFALAESAVELILQSMTAAPPEQLPPVQTSVDELFDTEKLDTNKLDKKK